MFHSSPKFHTLACGLAHTICIDDDCNVWGFGDNSSGVVGQDLSLTNVHPSIIKSLENIKAVSCGFRHSVCLDFEGNVYTFGGNSHGQLGNNGRKASNIPYHVENLPPINSIACGRYFTICLSIDNTLYAFGDGLHGQIGIASCNNKLIRNPIHIKELIDVEFVDCGGYFTLCKTFDGKLYSWGDGVKGQLALGNYLSYSTPQCITDYPDYIISTACGLEHMLVLLDNGDVYSCGSNEFGQIGQNNIKNTNKLLKIDNLQNIIRIECGYDHSFCIDNENTLYVFGSNVHGQLGCKTDNIKIPKVQDTIGKITDTSIGGDHALVKTLDNEIYGFGWNDKQQLGIKTKKKNKWEGIRVFKDNTSIWRSSYIKSRAKSARK